MLFGWKQFLVLLSAVGAVAGTGYVFVDEVAHPGANSRHSGSALSPSSDEDGLVIRAIGDSVTAAFGYSPDGTQISLGEFPHCATQPTDPNCQDAEGTAYPAQFARRHDGSDFRSFAVSGSTPADWLGQGKTDLSSRLDAVVEADPDVTVLTLGANPLLEDFLIGGGRICATTPFKSVARACVRGALRRERLLPRLVAIYTDLLDTPPEGRNGLVVVFQYPETHPPSAFGVRTTVLIEELRSAIEHAAGAVRKAQPDEAKRLVVAEPGPFLDHGCSADTPWILRVDTCIHPNVAGHAQLASVLEGIVDEHQSEVPEVEPIEERFATPGTSCGVHVAENLYTADPSDRFESRLGVTRGQLPCSEVEAAFERYASDRSPCPEQGAGTCWREYGKWRCVAPTYSLYPADFTCGVVGDEKHISQIIGLYAKETTPVAGRLFCGNTRQGGGPFEIRANFDCRPARRLAKSATSDFNFGFLCQTKTTGYESSRTRCSLDDTRVEWINGA
jgi:lysophospholipase L1-like esterase